MRALVVEDNPVLQRNLVRMLERDAAFAAEAVGDGETALTRLAADRFEVVLLDLGLPEVDGMQVLRTARGRGDTTPVLVLTARTQTADVVEALHAGADDYMVKPFAMAELLARCHALARRTAGVASDCVTYGTLTIDRAAQAVTLGGRPVALRALEYRTLLALVQQAGAAVPADRLVQRVYGGLEAPDSNVIQVYVSALRRALGRDRIETVRGLGYRFNPDDGGAAP